MRRLSSLKSRLDNLPVVQSINITLIVGIIIGSYQTINLDSELTKQKKVLHILSNRAPHLSDSQYKEEFNNIIRYKGITIDQYVSKYSLFGPKSDSILAKYSMSLKGGYSNFMSYLQHIDSLKLIKTIHSLEMKNESDNIRMNLNLDVLYEKD